MKRLLKSWVFWVFVAPLALATLTVGVHASSAWAHCACGSTLNESAWLLGFEKWVVPMGSSSNTQSSRFREDLLPAGHVHAWTWRGGSRRCLMYGSYRCGGPPRVIAAVSRYERDPSFAKWLRGQLASGSLTSTSVELAVLNPATPVVFLFGWTPP